MSRFTVIERAIAVDARPERYTYRFAVSIVFASALWSAFLVGSTRLFSGDVPAPRRPEAIQMQLVELPLPAPSRPQAKHDEPKAVPVHAVVSKPVPMRLTRAPARPALPQKQPEAMPSHDALPMQAISTQGPVARAPADDARHASSASTDSTSTHSSATGNAQARLLSQPLPALPDDLREQEYQAVAVARFFVHADGTFDIELVKPTPNPRLNQILLETLHMWRFFPAMENGRPVESRQDVRVHFNVD